MWIALGIIVVCLLLTWVGAHLIATIGNGIGGPEDND